MAQLIPFYWRGRHASRTFAGPVYWLAVNPNRDQFLGWFFIATGLFFHWVQIASLDQRVAELEEQLAKSRTPPS